MLRGKGFKLITFTAFIAALLSISMLVGSTYAAPVNKITGEGAQFTFYRMVGSVSTEIEDQSDTPIFNNNLWEPGYTLVEYFQLECSKDVSFQFSFQIATDERKLTSLAEVIDVYYLITNDSLGNDRADALSKMNYLGTLKDVLAQPSLFTANADGTIGFAIALQMRQSAGNTYQGMSLFSQNDAACQFNVILTASTDIPTES